MGLSSWKTSHSPPHLVGEAMYVKLLYNYTNICMCINNQITKINKKLRIHFQICLYSSRDRKTNCKKKVVSIRH